MSKQDRNLALVALALTIRTRKDKNAPLPFTVGWLQACCRQIGKPVGEHRASRMIAWLKASGKLREASSYRSKAHGFNVLLYLAPQGTSSVRRRENVKWFEHPLFGMSDGKSVEGKSKAQTRRLKRWREPCLVTG